ncbi:MAG: recombinase family protein [Clostridia bacterium]|nr:recombinase family protein [Clostridia bacterium]
MSKVKIIPANPVFNIPRPYRVAAYCRVSTPQEMQYHSLEAQRKHFEKYIDSKLNWIFVGVYAEQASGRHNVKMKEFQRMMDDCRSGKIDFIIVKSISRLGRNTLQFLQVCDELNALNIDVYFEVEKLHINDPQAVRMLTLYASVYQNESETKSYGVRWGHLVRFKNGNSKFYNRPCYGYRQSSDGTLEIVPAEAAVVIMIFTWREEGSSLRAIAKELMDMKIPAPRGGKAWGIETIRKILNNEKYYGDVCLQKTYIADYFTGKQIPNRGERDCYLLRDHHTAIIPKCK